MAIVQTGSVLTFPLTGIGGDQNTGTVSTTITVPADAELVIAGWSGFSATANFFDGGSMTFTKGGVDTAMTAVAGTTSNWSGALFYLALPDTGSNKTLKWDWLGTGAAGDPSALCSVTFWKGIDTASPARGNGFGSAGGLPYTTGTITAASGDLIIAWVAGFVSAEGTINSWSNLTLLSQIARDNSADGAWATGSPSGNTTVAASTATNFADGSIWAVSFKAAASGSPFFKSDWDVQKKLRLSTSLDYARSPSLFPNPIPFNSFERAIQKLQTPRLPDASRSTNLNLFKNPIPFNKTNWVAPETLYGLSQTQQPYNNALYSVTINAPFYQTNWPIPSLPRLIQPQISYNNVLYATPFLQNVWAISKLPQPVLSINYPNFVINQPIAGVPFNQLDWPKASAVPQASFDIYNMMIVSAPADVPFVQYDWPKTKSIVINFDTKFPNIALINQTVVNNPFNLQDWSKTNLLISVPSSLMALNINLFTNPIPFAQYNWTNSSTIKSVALDKVLYNLNLYAALNPFVPINWSKSFAPVITQNQPLCYNLNLYSAIDTSVPFNQQNWPLAQQVKTALSYASQNFIPLSTFVFVPVPFNQLNWPVTLLVNKAKIETQLGSYEDLLNSVTPVIPSVDVSFRPNNPVVPDSGGGAGKTKQQERREIKVTYAKSIHEHKIYKIEYKKNKKLKKVKKVSKDVKSLLELIAVEKAKAKAKVKLTFKKVRPEPILKRPEPILPKKKN